jgi:hypothetical protein
MDQLVAYQVDLQRQVKRSVGYQVKQLIARLARKIT